MSSGSNTPALVTVLATSASAFADGIGVNTHIDFSWTTYNDFAQVENALAYLGVTVIRDSMDNPADPQKFQELNAALGVKLDDFISPGSAGFTTQLQWIQSNANVIAYLEGPNESDNWPQTYDGLSGLAATEAEQQALEAAKSQYANLAGIPLIQSSFGNLGTFSSVAGIASDASYANAHIYFGTHNNPGSSGWIQTVDADAKSITSAPGLVVTETGYETMDTNLDGVDDTVQAKYDLDDLFDEWQAGASLVNLYELVDEASDPGNTNEQDHYGLFNADWTPKPAAIALHNLLTILNSTTGATGSGTLQSLAYSVTGMPTTGNSELFQKADGTFVLAMWNDVRLESATSETDIIVPSVNVTLNLGQSFAYIDIFDPLSGTAPIEVFDNTSVVNFALPDHPVLIEMSQVALPTIATGPLIAAPAQIVTTEDNQVQVDGLQITDTASGTLTVDIGDATGTLSYTDASGTVHAGQSLDITGTTAVVNAALATLQYTGANATGSDTVTLYAMDGANLSSSESIAVTVDANPGTPAATGPSLTLPSVETFGKSTTDAVSGISLADAYGAYNMGAMLMSVSDSSGLLSMTDWSGNTVAGSGGKSITYSATFVNLVAALDSLTYTAGSSTGTDTIHITIYDQVGLSTTRTIAVDVVASAPVVAPVSPPGSTSTASTSSTSSVSNTQGTTSSISISSSSSSSSSGTASTPSDTTGSTSGVSTASVSTSPGIAYSVATPVVATVVAAQGTSSTLALGNSTAQVVLGTNQGTTTIDNFAAGSGGNTLVLAGSSAASVTVAPDMLDDIVWNAGPTIPVAWSMNGSSVSSVSFIGSAMPSFWTMDAMGDFSGNGYSDILWTPTALGGTAFLWMTTASGEVGVSLAQYGGVSTKAWTGDFNGDGKSDILWDFGSATPVLWMMNGSTVTSCTFLGVDMPAGYQIGGVGDFSGDGRSDILWVPTTPGGTAFLWMTGVGGTTVQAVSLAAYGPVSDKAWVGDFTGNGDSDILWDFGSADPVLWVMNGGTVVSASFYGSAMPAGWNIAAVGDLNGDGRADVLWTNSAGGALVWLSAGNGGIEPISYANLGAVPSQALIGNLTSVGTTVTYGNGSQAVLAGVTPGSLTGSNIVAEPTTADFSADTAPVNIDLATGASSTGSNLGGIQSVVGTAYNDTLEGKGTGGAGSTLTGNGGNDTYNFSGGDGMVSINNGVASNNQATGQVDFLGSLSDENLWFVRSGNNLVVDVLGSSDQVTVNNWYGNAYNQVSEISAGSLKLDTQLATLVQAMATYSADNTGFNPTTATAMPADTTLQTAIATAWHG